MTAWRHHFLTDFQNLAIFRFQTILTKMKFVTVLVASLILVTSAQDLPEAEQRELASGGKRLFRQGGRYGYRHRSRSRSSKSSSKYDYCHSGKSRKLSSKSHHYSTSEKKTCHTLCKESCPKPGAGTGGKRCRQICDKQFGFFVAPTPPPTTKKPTHKPTTKPPKA